MRAGSHEGKLQVHLAQLNNTFATPCRSYHAFSRQAGELVLVVQGKSAGVELPSVRNQITDIERQLKAVERTGKPFVKTLKSPVFKIGLIGYTNAGKSTIMNQLTSKPV